MANEQIYISTIAIMSWYSCHRKLVLYAQNNNDNKYMCMHVHIHIYPEFEIKKETFRQQIERQKEKKDYNDSDINIWYGGGR